MNYEILLRFLLAALWGGIVGIEREYRSKSAGFRTMIMISVGSCFFTTMSTLIGSPGNPDRIASNIVTGIGFLGAGVIFRGDSRVHGITTAATIWTVAAVGMGIGAGYYLVAAFASVLIIVVLAILHYCENMIDKLNRVKLYSVTCIYTDDVVERFEQRLKDSRLQFKIEKQVKQGTELSVTWQVQGHEEKHRQLVTAFINDSSVLRFEY